MDILNCCRNKDSTHKLGSKKSAIRNMFTVITLSAAFSRYRKYFKLHRTNANDASSTILEDESKSLTDTDNASDDDIEEDTILQFAEENTILNFKIKSSDNTVVTPETVKTSDNQIAEDTFLQFGENTIVNCETIGSENNLAPNKKKIYATDFPITAKACIENHPMELEGLKIKNRSMKVIDFSVVNAKSLTSNFTFNITTNNCSVMKVPDQFNVPESFFIVKDYKHLVKFMEPKDQFVEFEIVASHAPKYSHFVALTDPYHLYMALRQKDKSKVKKAQKQSQIDRNRQSEKKQSQKDKNNVQEALKQNEKVISNVQTAQMQGQQVMSKDPMAQHIQKYMNNQTATKQSQKDKNNVQEALKQNEKVISNVQTAQMQGQQVMSKDPMAQHIQKYMNNQTATKQSQKEIGKVQKAQKQSQKDMNSQTEKKQSQKYENKVQEVQKKNKKSISNVPTAQMQGQQVMSEDPTAQHIQKSMNNQIATKQSQTQMSEVQKTQKQSQIDVNSQKKKKQSQKDENKVQEVQKKNKKGISNVQTAQMQGQQVMSENPTAQNIQKYMNNQTATKQSQKEMSKVQKAQKHSQIDMNGQTEKEKSQKDENKVEEAQKKNKKVMNNVQIAQMQGQQVMSKNGQTVIQKQTLESLPIDPTDFFKCETVERVKNGGYIIDGEVCIALRHWHCVTGGKSNMRCEVCSKNGLTKNILHQHVASQGHEECLQKSQPLRAFNLSLVRKVKNGYHCAICNQMVVDPWEHSRAAEHRNKLTDALKEALLLQKKGKKSKSFDNLQTELKTSRTESVEVRNLLKVRKFGFIVNDVVLVRNRCWNAFTGTNTARYCHVCQEQAAGIGGFFHIRDSGHKTRLSKCAFLAEFNLNLIRKIPNGKFYCSMCGETGANPAAHVLTGEHLANYEASRKSAAKLLD